MKNHSLYKQIPFRIQKVHLTIIVLVLTFFGYQGKIYAQQRHPLLQKFSNANQNKELSYEYKVLMCDMKQAKNIDSVKGRLYSLGGQFVDSSNIRYVARVGNYYCSFDHEDKTATICEVLQTQKRMKMHIQEGKPKVLFNISDTLIAALGNYVIDSSSASHYRLKARLKNYPVSYIQVDFRKDNFKMTEVYFETEDRSGGDYYLTRISISKISSTPGQAHFDLSKLFTMVNNKPLLKPAYSKYTLTPLE